VSALDPVTIARRTYRDICRQFGTDAVTEENAILSVDPKLLPPCALAVLLDSDAATVEYYDWLVDQTARSQAEHEWIRTTRASARVRS
jgi:hypothetical protein